MKRQPTHDIAAVTALAVLLGAFVVALACALMLSGEARAHEATTVAGAPLSVAYPMVCCSNRDCRPTAEGEVTETPQGYTLQTTGEVVPYRDRRIKPFHADGKIHVCQQAGDFDKGRILCLLVPPPSF